MATWQIIVCAVLFSGLSALVYFSGTDDEDPYDD